MGVTYLLDTHVLIWLVADPERVPARLRADLADRSNRLWVSAISAFEIATKHRLGKLDATSLLHAWDRHIDAIGAEQLPVRSEHAVLAGSLPWQHRDPFDRLLTAQAIIDRAVLVTVDPALTGLPSLQTISW